MAKGTEAQGLKWDKNTVPPNSRPLPCASSYSSRKDYGFILNLEADKHKNSSEV